MDAAVDLLQQTADQPRITLGIARALLLRSFLYWNTKEALDAKSAECMRDWSNALNFPRAIRSYGDGRLAAHEWVRTPDGRTLKTDCVDHTHDPTTIGQQSIAWDLAGAVVEWDMDRTRASSFLCAAGVPIPRDTFNFYRAAYAAFRTGLMQLCSQSETNSPAEYTRVKRA